MKRACGVLLPISALPSKYGIGCFSKEAYEFVDFLKAAGQSYWQVLPFGQTGYGDSPYQSFSTFAGNPYFIDLEELFEKGYLRKNDLEKAKLSSDPEQIDYALEYENRYPLLWKAYQNSPFSLAHSGDASAAKELSEFMEFQKAEEDWLADYALYCAVKKHFRNVSYIEWEEDIRLRKRSAMEKYRRELADEIRFYEFLQFEFMNQWLKLKAYANQNGIDIIGDIPIYVAFDSADTWSHPELYEFDQKGYPTVVAGCPPDAFSATGQLWGNPIYKWDYHQKTGYEWWIKRVRHCFRLADVLRIDHFRGFDEYYAIPYGDETAEFGTWRPGPGIELFEILKKELGKQRIIAEDLGFLTPSVLKLVKKTGYPGMKVLQFAFDSREDSDYLPHNYGTNCVVYTGTHDNQTTRGWYESAPRADRSFAKRYVGIPSKKTAVWEFIRVAFMSVADTVIIPMQDYLNLGDEARMNQPSTLGGNWMWRMKKDAITPELTAKMRSFAKMYGRLS
ncbi:MAG: 4-alpha-glucanotransferase [Lachnospiraceae bacterium]|nr:4-alpha-glucanotransferase [Lachnospiraceae bacterium]